MSPFTKMLLGVAARGALMALSGYLVSHDIIKPEQQGELVAQGVAWIVDSLPAALAFAWSAWQKAGHLQDVQIALSLPAGSSPVDVEIARKGQEEHLTR